MTLFSRQTVVPNEKNTVKSAHCAPETQSCLPPEMDGSRFHKLIETLPVMIYLVEPTPPYKPVYVNSAFESLGYPLEQWCRDADLWIRALHQEDREWVLQKTEAAMKAGEETDFEYRIVTPDDNVVWVRDRGCFIRDETGKAVYWQGIILDITKRKQALEALRESEMRYRALFENANDIMYVHDLAGNYLSINRAAEDVFGYSQEESLRMNMKQIIAPESIALARRMLADQAAGAGRSVYEINCLTKSGGRVTLEINSRTIFQDGEPVAIQGIARDITKRKQAETALQTSEAELRALFAAMPDVIFVIDADGRYLKIAPTNLALLYKPAEEMIGRTFAEIFPPPQAEYFLAAVRKALAKRESVRLEYSLDIDGREAYFVAIVSPLLENSVIFVARDISERQRAEENLKQSEEKHRELFENANDLIYTHDLQGFFTSLNRTGEIITGYRREEVINGFNIAQVVAPEYLEQARRMIARKVEGEMPSAYELDIIAKDGRRVSLELRTRLILQNGRAVGVQGIARDITQRKRDEKSLRRMVTLLSSTLESTADGILVTNPQGEIVAHNEKFLEMWRIPLEIIECKDDTLAINFVKDQLKEPEKFKGSIEGVYSQSQTASFDILEFKDGRLYERYSQPHIMEGESVGRVWSFRDITERRRAETQLLHNARHDTLTNLPNRAEFMNHLELAIEQSLRQRHFRFAVLFLDLDRFKLINDSLGHTIGDKLLVAIAERLQLCVRPGDIVARLGGDEFTILLNRSGESSDVLRVAERIQQKLSEPFFLDNYEVFTSASIGIIFSDEVRREPEDFLRDADTAMYRAKEKGKARCEIFDREMHVRNMNLLKIETDLRHAVERGEFEVFYQPIISLETGAIREFEALIRWRHPEHGLVAPDEFIGVAEETGLIIPIGKWVLEESCRQTAEWQKRFPFFNALGVSVNLSARQLMHPSLTAQIGEILMRSGLDARSLKLEVTESTVMEHSDTAHNIINDLLAAGISISTDDFGTGYSSLSYLHRFSFERLKIDRSFVSKMDTDEKSAAIVRTILMLGQNLNIEVVAEGIETESQLQSLRALGCELGQGYLFSKPVAAGSAEKLLAEGLAPVAIDASKWTVFKSENLLEITKIQ